MTNDEFWKLVERLSETYGKTVSLEPQRYGNDPGAKKATKEDDPKPT